MDIYKDSITNMTKEDRQLIYDAVVHYMYSEAEIGRSNHFAADIHAKEAEICSSLMKRMRKEWDRLIP